MGQIVKIQVVAKFQVLSLLLITGMAFFSLSMSPPGQINIEGYGRWGPSLPAFERNYITEL